MIKQPAQAQLNDVLGKNPVMLDVNFDGEYNDCIKVTVNGIESIIKYSDLFAFMFVLGNKEQQAKMTPVLEEKGHEYMRQHVVKLNKDMKAGEEMVVNCRIRVPDVIAEQIKTKDGFSTS